jgi:23S rRNA (adenine-N6)-dimethyltransferase
MRKYQLSQHFLRSPKLAGFLIGHSNIKKRDVVIDIGAGSGVITSALARRCKQVIAVEPDAETAALLRKNTKRCDNVVIVEKDFLEMELLDGPYKIFANPPFHLSSAILHKLDEAKNPPDAIYLILQKQFALKLLNNDRHYTSQLGKQLYIQYTPRIRLPLRPNYFTPPPAVPTVLLELKKRGQ